VNWKGVHVKNGRVVRIDLGNESLHDTLPNLNLPELTHLNLEFNNLTGNVPEFNDLIKLEDIDLSSNKLIGSIPPFTNSPDLQSIDLSNNQLSGCYADELIPLCSINYNFSYNPGLYIELGFCTTDYDLARHLGRQWKSHPNIPV